MQHPVGDRAPALSSSNVLISMISWGRAGSSRACSYEGAGGKLSVKAEFKAEFTCAACS